MEQEKLNEILNLHKKWLNSEPDGERANLCGADLYDANLRGADLCGANLHDANLYGANLRNANLRNANLRNADLRDADLRGANLRKADLRDADLRGANLRKADLRDADLRNADLDFSCFPLWCGSLGVHFDDRQIIQLLYHLLCNVKFSKNVSEDVKSILLTDELIKLANKFHKVEECGKL